MENSGFLLIWSDPFEPPPDEKKNLENKNLASVIKADVRAAEKIIMMVLVMRNLFISQPRVFCKPIPAVSL